MGTRLVSSVAGCAGLLAYAFVASMTSCNIIKTPPPDPCANMPTPPPENGYPVGVCPFWVVTPIGDCPPPVAGFVDSPLPGSNLMSNVLCRYAWTNPSMPPTPADLATLPMGALPDCTYVTPQANADEVLRWARDELRNAVGPRLGANKDGISVRAIVLDTVPPAPTLPLPQGAQHGQTLAWMMQDLACETPAQCPFQVQSFLAIPRQIDPQTGRPVINPNGGSFGLVSDVTEALWSALRVYRDELHTATQMPQLVKTTPLRLIVVSAFGFDNHLQDKPCDEQPNLANGSVRAMYAAYMAASCLGALHVSAAGNSSGGDEQSVGLLCPARWDKAIVPTDMQCAALWGAAEWAQIQQDYATVFAAKIPGGMASLFTPAVKVNPPDHLLSVAGVDYHGAPLVLSRPAGCAESVALGLGGIGWVNDEQVPPLLTGTSVSAALAAARLGVRWYSQPTTVATDLVTDALNQANRVSFVREQHCETEPRVSCPTDIPWLSEPSSPVIGQNPPPSNDVKTALDARPNPIEIDPPGEGVCVKRIPHCVLESRAATTEVWPQPVDPLCIKCGVYMDINAAGRPPELWLDGNPSITISEFTGAAFIVEDESGQVVLTKPLSPGVFLSPTTITLTDVKRSLFTNSRAWLSVYAPDGRTVSQQIFVLE